MARYIDADELLRKSIKIEGHFDLPSGKSQNFSAINVTTIQNFPTADVAPVVHGRWVTEYKGLPFCSVCDYDGYGHMFSPYCPNCGAKMDRKDGNDNG